MKHLLVLALPALLLIACATPPGTSDSTRPPAPPTTVPVPVAVAPECNCHEIVPTKPPLTALFKQADWTQLPEWDTSKLTPSWSAWLESCKRLATRQSGKDVWREVCDASKSIDANNDEQIRNFYQARLQPWLVTTNEGADHGLITGYYEPLLTGSLTHKAGRIPLYGVPDDLLTIDLGDVYPELKGMRLRGRIEGHKVLPYWDRADIDAGHTHASDKVVAWVDDPIDAFFLEVQGSGRIKLDDGSTIRVNYADQNGRPYKSIGKWLVDHGELKVNEASMQGIRNWVKAHPDRLRELLDANPSYVFFRTLPNGDGGPIGALNVPLTDGYSAAIDPKFIPLGAPIYLATTYPNDTKPLNRLLQAQDTGGAIRGPIRVDMFWGYGPEPTEMAGKMRQQGQVWLLWPKGVELPAGK